MKLSPRSFDAKNLASYTAPSTPETIPTGSSLLHNLICRLPEHHWLNTARGAHLVATIKLFRPSSNV